MKGIHRVVIQNKRIRYDFTLQRNLTLLRGDSATGKTTLIAMVQEYINNGEDSNAGHQFFCELCKANAIVSMSAGGKSMLLKTAKSVSEKKEVTFEEVVAEEGLKITGAML